MDRKNGRVEDFGEFLSKVGSVPEDKIKFYLHWVRRSLKFSNYQLENINTERVSQYLDSLDTDEKIADWQVKQAADAVILFVEKYLKRSLKKATSLTKESRDTTIDQKGPVQWKQTIEETKSTIRLRHFSLSTEKTYLGKNGAGNGCFPQRNCLLTPEPEK